MSAISRRLDRVTGGAPALPLLVLFFLNLVDEFDQVAFGVLSPEIRDHFNLSEASVTTIASLAGALVITLIVPVGVLADRHNRLRLTTVAALAWGSMSVLTGLAPAVAILVLARFGAGLGRVMNEPVHASLLADFYPPAQHGRVFSFHRMANPIGIMLVLVGGLLGDLFGWQMAFVLLAIPTFIAVAFIGRLHEPARGASVNLSLAEAAEAAGERIPFWEGFRRLKAIPTLKRCWWAGFFLGGAVIPITVFFAFFYEKVYNVESAGPWGRAGITALYGLGAIGGLTIGSRRSTSAISNGQLPDLARYGGTTLVATGSALMAMAVAPWIGLSIAFTFLVGVAGAGFLSYHLPLVALVAPARLRSQAFSWFGLWFALGAVATSVVIGGIGEDRGYRIAIGILSVLVGLAGTIYGSARRFVAGDVEQAFRALEVAARIHEGNQDGSNALLVCRNVDVAYDQVQVLFGVDLEIHEGEIVALLGTNGAGKSTLLKAISGLNPPVRGSVYFAGQDVSQADPKRSAELGIIQMPGGRSVFPTLTIDECLRLAGWMYKRSDPGHVREATARMKEHFPVLRERGSTMAGDLSGGEQQMLGLAMAFIAKPRLLMIDELTLGLAPTIVDRLIDIVRAIHDQGTTIILVEQSVNTALLLAERAIFMEKGEVRFSGATADLLERDDILRSVFLEGAAQDTAPTNGSKPKPASLNGAASLVTTGEVVLRVSQITKRFGGIRAVDAVSFELHQGEILGLIGPNGAGKTTVMDLISGFLPLDGGHIHLGDHDITAMSPEKRARLGLGRSFQDARLFPSMTVAENIAIGLERHLHVRDPLASALGLPAVRESEDEVAWQVHDLIELLGLGAFRNKFLGELSTGSRRIVDLALAIGHRPHVLLLDEPSSGIAQRETEALGPLLLRIQRETGCSLLVIEHDMPLLTSLAHRIVALELGREITTGTPDEVVHHPQVLASYLGSNNEVIARSGARA